MIRLSEAVLPGHPDKLCDQLADAVVAAATRVDADAYAQVEAGVWSDRVWLSGGVCTRRPLDLSLEELVPEVALQIGYDGREGRLDARRYQVASTVCFEVGDPARWTAAVNDQSIVVGWAGYDARTRHLPPEHFLAHSLRTALTRAFRGGPLDGHGPDGKLLVRLREASEGWCLEHLLLTVQQGASAELLDVSRGVALVARDAYQALRLADRRWLAPWEEVELLVNPNGPLIEGGSEGDNGQTGRKLVADFYGPRVPLGGGALSGKHLSHVDRLGAYAARAAALHAVKTGASECLVRLAFAPNVSVPLEVTYEMTGRGERRDRPWFEHGAMRARYAKTLDLQALARGDHFLDPSLPWNA